MIHTLTINNYDDSIYEKNISNMEKICNSEYCSLKINVISPRKSGPYVLFRGMLYCKHHPDLSYKSFSVSKHNNIDTIAWIYDIA